MRPARFSAEVKNIIDSLEIAVKMRLTLLSSYKVKFRPVLGKTGKMMPAIKRSILLGSVVIIVLLAYAHLTLTNIDETRKLSGR